MALVLELLWRVQRLIGADVCWLSGFGFEGHAGLGEESGDEVALLLAGA